LKLRIREYVDDLGRSPIRMWLKKLAWPIQARIQAKILRMEEGNLGDHKAMGNGMWEARLNIGPGYRIYFGKSRKSVILLLLGGAKKSQSEDISKAKRFWKSYKERENAEKKL
jgi:putative addiction module killer protein